MKSGASYISKNILSFSSVHWDDGGKTRAATEQGTALSPKPDRLQPNRAGSGKMRCRKRVSERLQRASTHYATRMAFLLPEKHLRVRRLCVSPDRDPESIGASAFPVARETGKRREMRLRTPREGRSFTYPNPDNLFIRRAAGLCLAQGRRSRRTPFSTACRTIILCP